VKQENIRAIFYFKNYYLDFFSTLNPDVKNKFNWTLQLISMVERIPSKFFKHMEGSNGLYEIRVEIGSDIFRVFSFFDKDKLIILVNGFQKKSQKTPKNELQLAEKLKKEYFYEKENRQ
jgi:phage-related protein